MVDIPVSVNRYALKREKKQKENKQEKTRGKCKRREQARDVKGRKPITGTCAGTAQQVSVPASLEDVPSLFPTSAEKYGYRTIPTNTVIRLVH